MTTTKMKTEATIFCEGYHDRAFWAGCLVEHFKCTDRSRPSGARKRIRPADPWGLPLTGGQYGYDTVGGLFVRVQPCGGKPDVLPALKLRLDKRDTEALLKALVNVDSDAHAATPGASGRTTADVLNYVRQHNDSSANLNAAGEIEIDGGATRIAVVRWEAFDAPMEGVPDQQTLERLGRF